MTDSLPGETAELSLDPATTADWEAVRAVAHRMVDDMLAYLSDVRERPAWRAVPEEAKRRLDEPVPLQPTSLDRVYEQFRQDVLPYPTGNIHPRFWGWVMGTGTVEGMLAELLAGAMNAHVAGYDQSATVVERQVIRWLAELMGFPPASGGLLVSGGTEANLIGVAVARNALAGFDLRSEGLQGTGQPRLLVYASTETHSWLLRTCELLGLGRRNLRAVPVDGRCRVQVQELRRRIEEDRAAGHLPFCVVGNAGTVNTGAVDDLRALAHVSREHGLWFHVDGAFGAMAALAPALRSRVAGLDLADSLAFDLHKWGYVQYEAGCVLVKDQVAHRAAFASAPAYLRAAAGGISVDPLYFADLGIQLSRGFRALKVWMSLKAQGATRWGELIQQNAEQAEYLASLVDASAHLERLAPVALNVVCFRYTASGLSPDALDALNEAILVAVQQRGIAVPSSTRLGSHGPFALRVAITNHRTRREDLRMLVEAVLDIGATLRDGAEGRPHEPLPYAARDLERLMKNR